MASLARIKGIGFDLGGVVVTSEREAFIQRTARRFGLSATETLQAVEAEEPALDQGEITEAEFWQHLTKRLGVVYQPDLNDELWNRHYHEDARVDDEILTLIDDLRQQGYRLGCLSNTHADHVKLEQTLGIFVHFDAVCLSNQIHAVKPQPEAYQALCQALMTEPGETIFIDNLAANVAGAEAAGLIGIKYQNYDGLIRDLKNLQISISSSRNS